MERTLTSLTDAVREAIMITIRPFKPYWSYVRQLPGGLGISLATQGFGNIAELRAIMKSLDVTVVHNPIPPIQELPEQERFTGMLEFLLPNYMEPGDVFVLRNALDFRRKWLAVPSQARGRVTLQAVEAAQFETDVIPFDKPAIRSIPGVEDVEFRDLSIRFRPAGGVPSTFVWKVAAKAGFHLDLSRTLETFCTRSSFWFASMD